MSIDGRELANRVAVALQRTSATARSLACASPDAALAACGDDEDLLEELNNDLARLEFHIYQKQPGYMDGMEAMAFPHLYMFGQGVWTGRSRFGAHCRHCVLHYTARHKNDIGWLGWAIDKQMTIADGVDALLSGHEIPTPRRNPTPAEQREISARKIECACCRCDEETIADESIRDMHGQWTWVNSRRELWCMSCASKWLWRSSDGPPDVTDDRGTPAAELQHVTQALPPVALAEQAPSEEAALLRELAAATTSEAMRAALLQAVALQSESTAVAEAITDGRRRLRSLPSESEAEPTAPPASVPPPSVPPPSVSQPSTSSSAPVEDLAELQLIEDLEIQRRRFSLGCRQCGVEKGLKQCTQCKTVSYCSRECQRADWAAHKQDCKALSAARKAGKAEMRNPAYGPSQFAALMTYTASLVNVSMSDAEAHPMDLGREACCRKALTKLLKSDGPLREMSTHMNQLCEDERSQLELMYCQVLSKQLEVYAELDGSDRPRDVLAFAERIRTRLQRLFSPLPILESVEGLLELTIGHVLMPVDREQAKQHLQRALQLHGSVHAPAQVRPRHWPGPLRDLSSIAADERDLTALRAHRESALERCGNEVERRTVRLQSALLCQQAVESIREEAQQLLRDNPAIRSARSERDLPAGILATLQRNQLDAKSFSNECEAVRSPNAIDRNGPQPRRAEPPHMSLIALTRRYMSRSSTTPCATRT